MRKRNTSGVLTSAGGLPTTEKNTLRSKATASQVFRRAQPDVGAAVPDDALVLKRNVQARALPYGQAICPSRLDLALTRTPA